MGSHGNGANQLSHGDLKEWESNEYSTMSEKGRKHIEKYIFLMSDICVQFFWRKKEIEFPSKYRSVGPKSGQECSLTTIN